MDKDLKDDRNINVNRDDRNWGSNQGSIVKEHEPTRRPSEGFEGSTGSISGDMTDEDSEMESEIEFESEKSETTESKGRFAEGSRNSRSQLNN